MRAWLGGVLAALVVVAACSGGGDSDEAEADEEEAAASTTSGPQDPTGSATGDGVVAPLLGLPSSDPESLVRPTLAVKLGNTEQARPQTGLVEADIVIEELVEGGLTRLIGLFQSQVPPEVGPVRSARISDIPVVFPFGQPLFATSGANPTTTIAVQQSGLTDVSVEVLPAAYQRRDDREAPDDLYADTAALYQLAPEFATPPPQVLTYRAAGTPAAGGRSVDGVDIDYGGTEVSFRWDDDLGGWRRSQDGDDHVDADDRVVAPQNVLISFVEYVDTDQVDSEGVTVRRPVVDESEGTLWVLTDGQLIEGTWNKGNFTNPFRYLNPDGTSVEMTPGQTWILLPEPGSGAVAE
jgi:hypothetical protein